MSRLFVYGTLKRGFRAHHYLSHARFLGEATTDPRYHLHAIRWFPGMVEDESTPGGVQGELYEVTESDLRMMDGYEGAPDLFRREEIDLSDGTSAIAYLFNHPCDNYERVEGGVWNVRDG
jgi:gamma-glutamylcyclotransferase (GGCT)/AIG2-like uncharacterized protein YtfP